jgi:hypothetical protein
VDAFAIGTGGTITVYDFESRAPATASTGGVIISEVRTSGPGNPSAGVASGDDDFLELYNTNNFPITVQSSDNTGGWTVARETNANCGGPIVVAATIPNGTYIPARGHYLIAPVGHSLNTYPAGNGTTATPDLAVPNNFLPQDRNIGLFSTTDTNNFTTTTHLDALGFGPNPPPAPGQVCVLLSEGTPMPNSAGSNIEHSFLRKLTTGFPKDTNDNSADFVVVAVRQGAAIGQTTPVLGAPGPENTTSPINRTNSMLTPGLIDPNVGGTAAPNRVRDTNPYTDTLTPSSPNGTGAPYTLGTLKTRRRYTNNTSTTVTRLRFRTVDITSGTAPAGTADIRLLTSTTESVMTSNGPVTVQGLVLEQPPVQLRGGGLNASVSCCFTGSSIVGERTVTLAQPLTPGQSIDIQFLNGVVQSGTFRFFVVIELLP